MSSDFVLIHLASVLDNCFQSLIFTAFFMSAPKSVFNWPACRSGFEVGRWPRTELGIVAGGKPSFRRGKEQFFFQTRRGKLKMGEFYFRRLRLIFIPNAARVSQAVPRRHPGRYCRYPLRHAAHYSGVIGHRNNLLQDTPVGVLSRVRPYLLRADRSWRGCRELPQPTPRVLSFPPCSIPFIYVLHPFLRLLFLLHPAVRIEPVLCADSDVLLGTAECAVRIFD